MSTEIVLLIMEWIGTISFAASGALVAIRHSLDLFGVVTVGTITAVGGGVLRDILVNEKPYILTKHVYAVASILGCLIYYLLSVKLNHTVLATVLVLTFVVSVRALAAKFRWKLPKIKID